ncbi:hypothetical protein F4604DRAFT_1812601, partial [Suillus subluteus]
MAALLLRLLTGHMFSGPLRLEARGFRVEGYNDGHVLTPTLVLTTAVSCRLFQNSSKQLLQLLYPLQLEGKRL